MEREKDIDESWKESISNEKSMENLAEESALNSEETMPQLDFFNYIASLGFQALIFLGEMPNPITNKMEKNLKQAKFLIDTLVLIREKTTGNLTKEEGELLNNSLYQLQMKYVELAPKEDSK